MEKKTLIYALEIERHDDGYLAHFPALPGCHTWGKTYEAAVKHAEEALIGFFGVEGVPVEHSTAPKAVACVKTGSCDVAVMGIEPSRAAEVDFTPPLIEIDYTFLVPAGSLLRNLADIDRPDVRIAAMRSHASTLALVRILKQGKVLEEDRLALTFGLLRDGNAVTAASKAGSSIRARV